MKHKTRLFALLMVILVIVFIADIFTGNAPISIKDGWNALFGTSGNAIIDEIVFNYRLPKAITAIL